MMTVVPLKGAARDCARYASETHDAAKGVGYYQQRDGAPSAWHGALADEFGLSGSPVDLDVLTAALDGHMPNGVDISARGNRQADHRLGADLTFHAPKSVSIAALAVGDEGLVAAHERAVARALKFIEAEVVRARLGRGGTRSEVTGKMLAASFLHETSRPVDGHADPQLHTHCLLANVTQRSDGTWCAMDLQFGFRGELIKLAGAVYRAELAKDLQSQGIELRRTADGFFELASITDAQIEHFSQRSQQIEKQLAERGTSRSEASAKEKLAANHATRENKKQIPKDQQRWEWRTEARAQGVDLTTPERAALVQDRPDLSAEAVRSGARHISERETVFSANGVRLAALNAGIIDADIEAIDREIASGTAGLLSAGEDDQGRALYTTRDALYREQHTLARARAGGGKVDALMTDEQVRDYISQREQSAGFKYSDGQRDAIALALTTHDTVSGVVGAAGAGKTTSMKEIVAAYQGAGYEVIGIAPSARARDELASAGAEVNRTVASFLAHEHDHNPQRLVVLDEAGMVSARDMDALMQKMEAEGGRLVLVGDPRQLQAVEAGQPFAQMLETGGIEFARIDEVKRQTDPVLREIAQRFARGDAAGAIEKARAYMVVAPVESADPAKPTTAERREAIARHTAQTYLGFSIEKRARTLVLSGTNAVRQQVNEVVRARLQEQGVVSRAEVQFRALDKSDFTVEKAARAESYRAGMVVRLEEGKGRNRHAIDYTVDRVDGNRVVLRASGGVEKAWNPAREKDADVYLPREMPLAVGDQIVFRDQVGAGGDKIENGRAAVVERVSKDGIDVRLDDGRQVRLDPEQGRAIDYGWCRTINAAQGATVPNVIVAGESSRVATAESAYVACTRVGLPRDAIARGERESLTIVTDNAQRLQKSWETWAGTQHAITAARDASRPDAARLQALRAEARAELGNEGDLAVAREARTDRKRDTDPERSGRGNASDGAAHAAARAEIEQAQGQLAATRAEIGKDRGREIDR